MQYKCLVECIFVAEVEVRADNHEQAEEYAQKAAMAQVPGADDYARIIVEEIQ